METEELGALGRLHVRMVLNVLHKERERETRPRANALIYLFLYVLRQRRRSSITSASPTGQVRFSHHSQLSSKTQRKHSNHKPAQEGLIRQQSASA